MQHKFDPTKALLPGLPAYVGGRMSDSVYDAGKGRYSRFNDGQPFSFETEISNEDYRMMMRRFTLAGYEVRIEESEADLLKIRAAYGSVVFEIIKQGNQFQMIPVENGRELPQEAPCLLRAVTETTKEAFQAYLHGLEPLGYHCIWEHHIEQNLYRELRKDDRLLYAYYMGITGAARFIDDPVSAPITALNGRQALPGEKTAVCQFGLFYDRMVHGVSANCGMLYMLKLPDRSVFVIDGGEYEQATEEATAEVWRVMRELSQTVAGEKIPIAGWFCTHAHDDHMDLFGKILRFHYEEIDLQRIIFNFPSFSQYPLMPSVYGVLDRINRLYPNALYLKPHAGQEFTIAGVQFQFLQTHEDSVGALGTENIGEFNNTSVILKISFDGVSFMVLGDVNTEGERVLLTHYGPETLRSTGVQAAHHLINMLPRMYAAISPAMALVPCHGRKASSDNEKYQALAASVPQDQIFFASDGTSIWVAEGQGLKQIKLYPVVGGTFDQSAI